MITEQAVRIAKDRPLLPESLQLRNSRERFTPPEKAELAAALELAWSSYPERCPSEVRLLSIHEVIKLGYYVDEELFIHEKQAALERMHQGNGPLYFFGSIESPDHLTAVRAMLLELNNPATTLFTSYFPSERGDRNEEREDGYQETILLKLYLRDAAASGIRRIVLLDSHSPVFSKIALEYGIRVLDLSALPMLFDAAHEMGLFKGREVCVVSGDDGALEQGRVVRQYSQERYGYNCVAHLEGEKVKTQLEDGRRKVSIKFPPEKLELVRGRVAIIAEDIISTGGTLAGCIKELLEAGAIHVVVLVTFPIFAGMALETLGNMPGVTIITTDGRTPMPKKEKMAQAPNIVQLPLQNRIVNVAHLEHEGVDFWSAGGARHLLQQGFCLAPWQTHHGVR